MRNISRRWWWWWWWWLGLSPSSSFSTIAELLSVQTIVDVVRSATMSVSCPCLKFAAVVESCVYLNHLVSFSLCPVRVLWSLCMYVGTILCFLALSDMRSSSVFATNRNYFHSVTAPSPFLVNILLCKHWRCSHYVVINSDVCSRFSFLEARSTIELKLLTQCAEWSQFEVDYFV